ncbi:BcPKS5, polyketide synthase [Niveomyces insectorum RCEF 264]|uniref:BcPKS5, polyketide synthase n=1 Tax=Niveomyces insectorum RCEF 264 TaxID=1081102 RepID=A0A167YTL4_9HYPO|nr:BcPKS5, polyketide synthase [Niveomyces insectorum RCEF 264]
MAVSNQEPIAVIGMACRFPGGANTPSKLWDLLQSPTDLSQRVPVDRFDVTGFYHANGSQHGATDATKAYFLEEDVNAFDNTFFNIQPTEAEAIDPQQRMLLETVYDSLCAGGQTIEKLRGSNTAVFVGQMCDDWAQVVHRDWDLLATYAATGTSRAIISNRISYFFDWHGPSTTVDTACSSSLVAVHQGVTALRNGECPVAVAAGANLILGPGNFIAESNLHMLSPTGSSKMWDAGADGYARGEGIAAVVLKTLSAALRDGDRIDCIIRGTAVNQDGKTAGLTMPSNVAQANLIRDTYLRAGLDINDPKDRPQFFHAHGTGTPAGDPQEAEAIARCFFGSGRATDDKLYVGSVKTIIGHTEGSAGLASFIASALAMQKGIIPPNLHFNRLSPRVAPFYTNLEIPTTAKPWPETRPGQPRRASVNSFGFGGTNAHAIIESYEPGDKVTAVVGTDPVAAPLFTPLPVSAASPSALRAALDDLRTYLSKNPKTSLHDLAYTLQTGRSTLGFRQAILAPTIHEAAKRIGSLLADASNVGGSSNTNNNSNNLATRYYDVPQPKILGVFTGQGAQWPRMGARLLEESPFAAQRIAELQRSLSTLPMGDRPTWTLYAQLVAGSDKSRLSEAAIAQPLCTAVQIVLVDLVRAAGIRLAAVVGHSSGEIGAAYAAGFLSASTAIRVAYYRGLYAQRASSPSGAKKGAMMAVGTSFDDARDLCELDDFAGRIQVAACNSSTSITLSGDDDAIEEALSILKDEGKFARPLRVDTAYHSTHMLPCVEPYLTGLARAGYDVDDGNNTTWFSSVIESEGGHAMTKDDVRNPQYWADNMTSTVLFESAVSHAVADVGPFDMAIEFGPHPALKGPALDTVEQTAGHPIPYTGLLARGKDDVNELATALGYVWTHLGASSVDFRAFEALASPSSGGQPRRTTMVTDLPTYPFDHSRSFGALTRVSGGYRNLHAAPHPLLGRRLLETEKADEIAWRNVLRISEISWLPGHALQGQTVFPAAGYISIAVEAVAAAAADAGRRLGLITLEDVDIARALAFADENDGGMETRVTLSISRLTDTELSARIAIHSGPSSSTATPLALNFTATAAAAFHSPEPHTLPVAGRDEAELLSVAEVEPERLYSQFATLGYNYKTPFTGVRSIQRRLGWATGEIQDESGDASEDQLLLHPGWLDSAIQTGFAAYSHPHDNRFFTLVIPTAIRSIVINPSFFDTTPARNRTLRYQTAAHPGGPEMPMVLDIDIFTGGAGTDEAAQMHPFLQIDSVEVRPFATPTARDDAVVFSRFDYGLARPDADLAVGDEALVPAEITALWRTLDRIGFYYLRRLRETITPAERSAALPHFQHLLGYADRLVASVVRGESPVIPREAVSDSPAFVRSLIAKGHDRADVQMIKAVGENLVDVLRSGSSMLEHMMVDGLLDRFYAETAFVDVTNLWIARIVAQIAHRFPHMNLFEAGAGTGSTTRPILGALKGAFASYTFTDISAGFVSRAQEQFERYEFADRLNFATFDADQPADRQGFALGAYDIVIASNILHATADLDDTMDNIRGLLRPGGYLIALEIVSEHPVGMNATLGGLPGWWAGADADPRRTDGPCLTLDQWDALVRRHSFGGIDTHTPVADNLQWFSVWVAQAVDERIENLRTPLSAPVPRAQSSAGHLLVVGGRTPDVGQLAEGARALLAPRYKSVTLLERLEDLATHSLVPGSTVLALVEVDEPFLETRTEPKLNALKALYRDGGTVLWASRGARAGRPFSALLLGLSRVVAVEYPNIRVQVLDFDETTEATPQLVAEALVRLELGLQLEKDGARDDLLWTLEPETHMIDGRLHLPRLRQDTAANKRYNTYRRAVYHEVDIGSGGDHDHDHETVLLEPADGGKDGFEIVTASPLRVPPPLPRTASGKTVTLRVDQSLLQAVKIQDAGCYALFAGHRDIDGDTASKRLVAVTATPVASRTVVPVEWTVPVPSTVSTSDLTALLLSAGALLLAHSILAAAPPFGTVLAHEADGLLRDALDQAATKEGRRVVFTTGKKANSKTAAAVVDGRRPYIFVHAKLPARRVRSLLPRHVSYLVNLAPPSDSDAQDLADLIARSLPRQMLSAARTDFVRTQTSLPADPNIDADHIGRVLRDVWRTVANRRAASWPSTALSREKRASLLPLQEAAGASVVDTGLRIVDWTASRRVRALVRAIDHGAIFRADGTYFLAGLAGDMGQSLCAWMVSHGARHIVLGSRRPKVPARFVDAMAAEDATVKVIAVDITRRESLRAAYDQMRAELPPVVGVANGAMLLEDALFDNMEFASLQRTSAPKIDGSVLLDELFYDAPLDFFILFTSTAQVVGNGGQAAYVMQNQFMAALAAQRRDVRGVAGSNMAIGSVHGLGYFEQAQHLNAQHFTRLSYRNISVQDLHQLFAESILAGRPENKSLGNSEIVTGVTTFSDSPETHPQLRNGPRFSHMLVRDVGIQGRHAGGGSGGSKTERLRARLAGNQPAALVHGIVLEAFLSRLKGILMIPQEDSISEKTPFVEQGIDSIMAVEIRAWFLQELDVDLPVLKILGPESTVESLLNEAIAKIPAEILEADKETSSELDASQPVLVPHPVPVPAPVPVPVSAPVAVATHTSPSASADSFSSTKKSTSSMTSSTGNQSPKEISTPRTPAEETPLETPLETPFDGLKYLGHELEIQQEKTRRESVLASATEITQPMTYGQRSFWFLNHYIDDPTTFNIAFSARLVGPLNVQALAHAVEAANQRHEATRTRFFWSEDGTQTAMQGVLSKTLVRLETATITSADEAAAELDAMRNHRWDLGDWVQARYRLLTLSDNVHYLIMGTPHISMDGHSMSLMLLDINQAYLRPGRPLPAMPVASQIRAFGEQQMLDHSAGKFQSAIDYYRDTLRTLDLSRPVELLPFASTRVRRPLEGYHNNVARVRLDPALAAAVKQLARSHRVTSFHVYLAALQVLIFRMLPAETTDQLAIGIADANRLDSRFMGSVGNFLNVLPLLFTRTTAAGTVPTFGAAVEDTCKKVYGALEHSALPFDLLLDELTVPRSNAYPPVFQIFMDYKLVTREQAEMRWAGTTITEQKWHTARSSFDIGIELIEDHESAQVNIVTQDTLYTQEATDLFQSSYVHLLNEVVKPDGHNLSIDKLPKWNPVDMTKALELGKGPSLPYKWPSTVAHRIDQVITQHPENIAVKDGYGNVLSYSALRQRAEMIASALRRYLPGQGHEPPVIGVFQAPTADWIASMVAIFRAGAVYLPLDLKVSTARLRAYVNTARPTVVLADNETVQLAGDIGVQDPIDLVNVSTLSLVAEGANKDNRAATVALPDDPAYIIFTSGSTGEPKGVVTKHASFRAWAEGFLRQWGLDVPGHVVLLQLPMTSDGSLKHIIAAIATGGTLIVAPADARGDPSELTDLIAKHGVTIAGAMPSEWAMWFRFAPDNLLRCTALTRAWFGGERPSPSLLASFRDLGRALPNLRFFHSYGPTEATITTVKGEVDVQDPKVAVPLPSRILPHYTVYIVDDQFLPVPLGVPGQIIIGGAGVGTNEYLRLPKLTAEYFRADTFALSGNRPDKNSAASGRVYLSGDYGRLDEHGRLTVEGRVAGDAQVKVRGFRVELGEIEGVLLQEAQGAVAHAVVVFHRESEVDDDDGILVARVVMSNREHDDKATAQAAEILAALRDRLHAALPQYMVPAVIAPIDDIPLTAHGKVDRTAVQALPLPEFKPVGGAVAHNLQRAPLTPTEHRLAELWATVLPTRSVADGLSSARADFFHLGGNSLLLVKLQTAIKRALGDAPRLSKLMNTPDLAGMAKLLETEGAAPDWDREISLDAALLDEVPPSPPLLASQAAGPAPSGLRILVTGATGSLGKRIIPHLATDSRVAQIVALARPAEGRDLATLFPNLPKVRVVSAELPSLPPTTAAADSEESGALLSKLDVILHTAADRNFWDGYGVLRPVNVTAAKELAKLARRTGAVLHVLSSGALADYEADGDDSRNMESGAGRPRPDPADGYVASKWVAERYLANASRQVGLHVVAHRPTEAAAPATFDGPSTPTAGPAGQLNEAEQELVRHALQLSPTLGVRPNFAGIAGLFHLASLDEIAMAVAAASAAVPQQSDEDSGAGFRVVNHPGTASARADAMGALFEELLQRPENSALQMLPAVPALRWVGLAKRASLFKWFFTSQELVVTDEHGHRVISKR